MTNNGRSRIKEFIVNVSAFNSKPSLDLFQAPLFFFSTDKENRLVYLSPSFQGVLGYPVDSQLGQSLAPLLVSGHPLNVELASNEWKEFYAQSEEVTKLRAFKTDHGVVKLLSIRSYSEQKPDGSVVNHVIAQDVTNSFGFSVEMKQRFERLAAMENKLSVREKQVLGRVIAGDLNKVIARKLNVSERTVEGIRSRLIKKYEVNSIATLIRTVTEYEVLVEMFSQSNAVDSLLLTPVTRQHRQSVLHDNDS